MNIRLIAFLVVLTVLRFLCIGRVELSPDEAQCHAWSLRLDWCYFSKGPGVALAVRAGTALFGHTEFGVRFLAPLLSLGTSLLIFWLARRMFDARIAAWAVVLANVTPIFNVGGLVMTIDPLSIFFWAATLCALWLALERETPADAGDAPARLLWWGISGALIGCGFLCKWTNAVAIPSLLLLLLLTPRFRREFAQPGLYLMLAVFAPFVWPVWQWNSERGWPTLQHLSDRGGLEKSWWEVDAGAFFNFIGSHFGVYSPVIFALMLAALWLATRDSFARWTRAFIAAPASAGHGLRAHPLIVIFVVLVALALYFAGNFFDEPRLHLGAILIVVLGALVGVHRCKAAANIHWRSRFLAAFALPLIAQNLWVALHHDAEVNWTAPAAVSVLILAAHLTERLWRESRRRLVTTAIALSAAMSILAVNSDIVRAVGIPWPLSRDPSARVRGWRDTAAAIHDFRVKTEKRLGKPVFLIAENYGLASELAFYLPEKRIEAPGHPPVYTPESPVPTSQYHFWGRYDEYEQRAPGAVINPHEDSMEYGVNRFAGRTAIYIATTKRAKPGEKEKPTRPNEVLIPSFYEKADPDKDWNSQPEKPWQQFTDIELKQDGDTLRKLRIFVLPRYRPGTVAD